MDRTREGDPTAGAQRRELVAALALCLAGGALVLLAVSQPWARALVADLPGGGEIAPAGASVAPAVSALGLGALAAGAAIVATRGVGRIVVGLLVVAVGLAIIAGALRVTADPSAVLREPAANAAGHTTPVVAQERATAWPLVAVLGGVLTAGAGAMASARGRRWPSMSARYERSGVSAAPPQRSTMWDAIGRGDDPTA